LRKIKGCLQKKKSGFCRLFFLKLINGRLGNMRINHKLLKSSRIPRSDLIQKLSKQIQIANDGRTHMIAVRYISYTAN
jgi:hypothetical protein